MDAFAALLREFGPFFVVYYVAFHGGPNLLKQIGVITSLRFQTQDTIALRETDFKTHVFDQYVREHDRNIASEEALRQEMNAMKEAIQQEMKEAFTALETQMLSHLSDIKRLIQGETP